MVSGLAAASGVDAPGTALAAASGGGAAGSTTAGAAVDSTDPLSGAATDEESGGGAAAGLGEPKFADIGVCSSSLWQSVQAISFWQQLNSSRRKDKRPSTIRSA